MKKYRPLYYIVFVAIIASSFVFLHPAKIVQACTSNNQNYCLLAPLPGLGDQVDTTQGVGNYINTMIKITIGLISVLAVLMLVVGGIQYMFSNISHEIAGAKSRMTNAIFGLVLMLSSYLILNTINPKLVHITIGVATTTLTQFDDDKYAEAETSDGQDYSPTDVGTGGATQAICHDFASCKSLCTSTSNGATYSGTPHAPGVLDPSLAQPITGISLVSGGCRNCTAASGVLEHLRRIKPTVDSLIASGAIPNRTYAFRITSAYRPVKDQIRLMCAEGDTSIQKTVVGHTIAYPGTSKHGVGYAVDVQFLWDGKPVTNCGSTRSEGTIEKIMFGAGFARLKKEAWHFETDTSNPLTCTGSSCGEPPKCSP